MHNAMVGLVVWLSLFIAHQIYIYVVFQYAKEETASWSIDMKIIFLKHQTHNIFPYSISLIFKTYSKIDLIQF